MCDRKIIEREREGTAITVLPLSLYFSRFPHEHFDEQMPNDHASVNTICQHMHSECFCPLLLSLSITLPIYLLFSQSQPFCCMFHFFIHLLLLTICSILLVSEHHLATLVVRMLLFRLPLTCQSTCDS